MFQKFRLYPFAAVPLTAMLCLFILTVNPAQADNNPNPQPVIHSTWGAIKALYRAETPTDQTPEQSSVQKPGAQAFGGTYADQQRWRSLSQSQRNELICQTAYNHMVSLGGGINRYSSPSGYNCKTWVQGCVVPRASWYVASIPASAGWCRWNSGQYVQIVGYAPAGISINGTSRGQIVQASWGSYPHTMIIWSRDSYGVWVIDCNYDLRGGLTIHYISFATFQAKSGGCYTVYQVVGG